MNSPISSNLLSQLEAWMVENSHRFACVRQYPNPRYACDFQQDCTGCLIEHAALELRKRALSGDSSGPETTAPLVSWQLTDEHINRLQVASVDRVIKRARAAHYVNIRVRINGNWEEHEADWIKHMKREPSLHQACLDAAEVEATKVHGPPLTERPSVVETNEHSAKGLASAGSSAAVNPRDTVGGSAEPSGRPANQKCINGCGRPRQTGSQHCDECDPDRWEDEDPASVIG